MNSHEDAVLYPPVDVLQWREQLDESPSATPDFDVDVYIGPRHDEVILSERQDWGGDLECESPVSVSPQHGLAA